MLNEELFLPLIESKKRLNTENLRLEASNTTGDFREKKQGLVNMSSTKTIRKARSSFGEAIVLEKFHKELKDLEQEKSLLLQEKSKIDISTERIMEEVDRRKGYKFTIKRISKVSGEITEFTAFIKSRKTHLEQFRAKKEKTIDLNDSLLSF